MREMVLVTLLVSGVGAAVMLFSPSTCQTMSLGTVLLLTRC